MAILVGLVWYLLCAFTMVFSISSYWERLQQWCDNKIETTAVKRLSNTVNGRALKRSLPPLITFIIVAAILISHLSMLQWPESFSAFLLTSPAVAVAILSILAICTYPLIAKNVPLYGVSAYVVLAAVECTLGALAMSLPAFVTNTVNPGNRLLFALVTALVVTVLMFSLSKSLVRRGLNQNAENRPVDRKQTDPDESSVYEDMKKEDETDSASSQN